MAVIDVNGKTSKERHFARYKQIALVLMKYRLGDLVQTFGLEKFVSFRWIPTTDPWRKQTYSKPARTRMALEELGTSFVKVGQILSTRTDLLPREFTLELAKLQSSLQPQPLETIENVIDSELHRPVSEVFPFFDPNPVGVASIGQAHAATLRDGTEVIVKARKPGVMEQVIEDMDILRQMAINASKHWGGSQQYDLKGIVEEIAETLTAEMDYIKEGHNAEYFRRFFQSDSSVHIPRIFWEYTTSRVITLERIRGIGIADVASLDKAGFDRKALANRAVGLWTKMVFEGVVFHADPHPGNLFVESDGRLGLIDFGMVGIVDDEVREYLSNAVKGILDRDVDLLVDSLIDLGAVRRDGSREALRADLKHVMGHYPKLDLADLPVNNNFGELIAVVRRNSVQLPSNTFLLLKTMAMAQSLGKEADSEFDMFSLLEPNIKKFLKERHSPAAFFRRLPAAASELAEIGSGLPQRLNRILKSVERGELKIRTDVSALEIHLEHLERIINRMVIGVIVAAIILGAAITVLAFSLH